MINVYAASSDDSSEITIVSEESEVFQTEESELSEIPETLTEEKSSEEKSSEEKSSVETSSVETSEEDMSEDSSENEAESSETEKDDDNSDTAEKEQTSEEEATEETAEDVAAETETQTTSFWGSSAMYIAIGGGVSCIVIIAIILAIINKKRKKKREEERIRRREELLKRRGQKEKVLKQQEKFEKDATDIMIEPMVNPEMRSAGNGPVVEIGKVHGIGKRAEQQDSLGLSKSGTILPSTGKGVFAVVADGMGGLENGAEVSGCVVMSMLQCFDSIAGRYANGAQELVTLLNYANSEVNSLLQRHPEQRSGSTVISVIIRNDEMFWLSVGDSHIYLYRNQSLLLLNREHVYAVELDEKAARGEISIDDALSNPKRKALTSFVGIGKIELIDRNTTPVKLQPGDRILMMSDGVFGSLSDEEIVAAMSYPVADSGKIIEQMIERKNYGRQDNYTALIMEYKENW